MNLLKTISVAALLSVTAPVLKAQDSTTAAKNDSAKVIKKTIINASANYVSRLNYFGREDSLKSSGLFPILGIESKIGLYANASFIFTQNTVQSLKYAGTSIESGYKFPESKHFSGNVFYTQFLYTNTAAIVQSALKSQTGVNLTWKNSYVNVTAGGDLKFSDKTDIGVTGTVDHLFLFKIPTMKKTALAINPMATVNAGTQQFIQSKINKTGGIFGNLPGGAGTTITNENINRFNVLSYEFSMPFVFVVQQFYIALTPAYVIPQNLVTIVGRPDLSENGKNLFYVTATAGMRLQFR